MGAYGGPRIDGCGHLCLQEEKARLLEDILEAERQVMMWEKKIQLEKETQAALDPEVGQAEVKAMEKEIHRMTLRYETLKRDQERMIKEMERAIVKHEAIAQRFRGRKQAKGTAPTRAGLKRKLGSLKQNLKNLAVDTAGYEEAIRVKQAELNEVTAEVDARAQGYAELEQNAEDLQRAINAALYDKQRGIEALAAAERMGARYEALMSGRRPPMTEQQTESVLTALENAAATRTSLRQMIHRLAKDHPEMDEVLQRVSQLTEI